MEKRERGERWKERGEKMEMERSIDGERDGRREEKSMLASFKLIPLPLPYPFLRYFMMLL